MAIDLPNTVEEQLRDLAKRQKRDISTVVEEAIRQYLDSVAITDVEPGQIADTQSALLNELPSLPKWKPEDLASQT